MRIFRVLPALAFGVLTSAQTPSFEVASIRPNLSGGGVSSIRLTAGRVSMQNVTLKKVILNAYGIPDDREYMIDGPNWLVSEHFDIDATFKSDTPEASVRQMIQTLLAERFKLVLHRETRQLPIYSLTVAKNGPKIRSVDDGQTRTSGWAARGISLQRRFRCENSRIFWRGKRAFLLLTRPGLTECSILRWIGRRQRTSGCRRRVRGRR